MRARRESAPKCKSVFVAEAADDAGEFPVAASETETALAGSDSKTVAVPKPKLLAKVAEESETTTPHDTSVRRLKSAAPLPKATPAAAPPLAPAAAPPATSPTAPEATVAVAAAGISTPTNGSGAVYTHRRKKKSNATAVITVGAVGLIVLLGVGAFIAWSLQNDPSLRAAARQDSSGESTGAQGNGVKPPPPVDNTTDGAAGDVVSSAVSLADWSTLEKSLVDISIIDRTGVTRTGRGAVVDRRGWVATSYTLTHGATGAVVTFADGERLEAVGLLAERPQHNLALLQLDAAESELANLPALQIASQWTPEAGERVFLGTRAQAQSTTISGSAPAQSIPAGSRARLPNAAREAGGLRLIVHLQRIEDEQDGTPLLLANGKLAGICVALGPTRRGYTLPAAPLAEMLANAEPGKVAAFHGHAPPLRQEQPEPPREETGEQPFAHLQATVDLLGRSNWRPESIEHYEAFQLLAASLDAMQTIVDATPEELPHARRQRRDRLQQMIQSTAEEIAAAGMPDETEQARVNRLGLRAIAESGSAEQGVFLYGKCVMQPPDFGERSVDGAPGFAFEIVGTEELVVMGIGIPENGRQIGLGSRWLLLGVVSSDGRYRLTPDDQKQPRDAYVVRCKYLFGEQPGAQ